MHPLIYNHLNTSHAGSRGISLFYSHLLGRVSWFKSLTMSKWETELTKTYSEEQWKKSISFTYPATHCASHWELPLKTLHRWYLTLYRVSKIYPAHSPTCCRECGESGTLIHLLWHCRSVKPFWNAVFSLLSEIIKSPTLGHWQFFTLVSAGFSSLIGQWSYICYWWPNVILLGIPTISISYHWSKVLVTSPPNEQWKEVWRIQMVYTINFVTLGHPWLHHPKCSLHSNSTHRPVAVALQ